MDFRPTYRYAVIESSIVGIVGAIILPLLAYFVRGIDAIWVLVGVGAITGILLFAGYFIRFLHKAPQLVRIDEGGVLIERRGQETKCDWKDFTAAFHESSGGLRWRFELASGSVILRDDGLTTTQWDEITKLLNTRLAEHDIPVKTTGLAQVFDDDEEDE